MTDRQEEPATPSARQRFLQFLMDELDAYDWEQSGALDVYLTHADAIEREARPLPAPLDVDLQSWLETHAGHALAFHPGWEPNDDYPEAEPPAFSCGSCEKEYVIVSAQPSIEPAQGGTE